MSLYSFFTAGLAYAALASAYTQPKGDSPSGNPISQPGLNSVVPAGQSFSVTWQPTTQGTVTLVLLKGPSTNAEPQYAIAEKIPNNGLYTWTPSTDLAPTSDATGYGIQLIDDATGAYQYTTQFGISNDNYVASSSSASATTSSWSVPVHSGPPNHGHGGSWTDSWSDSWTTTATSGSWSTTVSGKPYSVNSTWTSTAAPIVTGAPSASYSAHNVTMVAPTGYTISSSLLTSATPTSASATRASSTGSATQTANAAAGMKASFAGLVLAGAVAVFAL